MNVSCAQRTLRELNSRKHSLSSRNFPSPAVVTICSIDNEKTASGFDDQIERRAILFHPSNRGVSDVQLLNLPPPTQQDISLNGYISKR